jgi:DNA-binding transcriptional MerR regulator
VSLLVLQPAGYRSSVERLARDAGLHPDTVRQLIRLGLIAPPFRDDAAAQLARAVRLRRDLGLNFAGAVLACDLLARIDDLERRLARSPSNGRHPR